MDLDRLSVRQLRKLELFRGTEEECAIVGFESASVVSIAKRAGNTNRSAVKYYFDDFEDAITQLCQFRFQVLSDLLRHINAVIAPQAGSVRPAEAGYWGVLAVLVTYLRGLGALLPNSYMMRFFRDYIHTAMTGQVYLHEKDYWMDDFRHFSAEMVGIVGECLPEGDSEDDALSRLALAGSALLGYVAELEAKFMREESGLTFEEIIERATSVSEFLASGLFREDFSHLRGVKNDKLIEALDDFGELDFVSKALETGLL